MAETWDWSGHTTYEFRTKRICTRFRYRFVRELFDMTMKDVSAFYEERAHQIDLVWGVDPRRTKHVAVVTGVFRSAGRCGVERLSDLADQVLTRDRAREFMARSGVALEDLKAALEDMDKFILPTQKSMRLLIPKGDKRLNRHVDKLAKHTLGNNLALLDAGRTDADRAKLSRLTGVPKADLLALLHRADMGRQHCIASMVDNHYGAGYDTMEKFRAADIEQAKADGVGVDRVLYARTRPRVLEGVPKLRMPPLAKVKPRPKGCGNNCPYCDGPSWCAFQKCVVRNRVPSCAHCSAFPCDAYDHGRPTAHLEKARAKLKPKQIIAIKPLRPQRPLIADFPTDLKLPARDKAALRHIHTLIVALRQALSGESFARRHMLNLTRRRALDMLWSMAHHGELVAKPKSHLYLEKDQCRSNGAHMPDPNTDEVEQLVPPGMRVEGKMLRHGTSGRIANHEARLYLDASVGGRGTLRMLRRFADALCRQHGEPQWRGTRLWKGEAFDRFLAADVTCMARAKA